MPSKEKPRRGEHAILILILLLAAGLRFWNLGQNGFGNVYYAAAARSMSISGHNFFYASFDPGGFISVDKPPVALWIQTLFVKALGFHGTVLILPQALAGVISVALLYRMVRPAFGAVAGITAALILALTPISVAVDRSNNPDSLLVLTLLLSAWALNGSIEKRSFPMLLTSAALLGVAFNIKMMAAFVVLPTFVLFAFSRASGRVGNRLLRLAIAGAALMAVSFSWALAVDSTPQSQRPYVGSSPKNSVIDLIFGYNGMGRLSGGEGNMPGGGMGGMMGTAFGGSPGPLRLVQPGMADQIAWLIPIALLGLISALCLCRKRETEDSCGRQLLLWVGWLLGYALIYSFAKGIVHQYYLATLAPPVAALAGIGLSALLLDQGSPGWRGWLLPGALLLSSYWQGYLLRGYPDWSRTLLPLLLGATLLAALALTLVRVLEPAPVMGRPIRHCAALLGLGATLLCPAAWSLTPVIGKGNGLLPSAGPSLLGTGAIDPMSMMQMDEKSTESLAAFLRNNYSGERYIVITSDFQSAASLIIDSEVPAAPLGGFLGADPVLTPQSLKTMARNGEVRYVLTDAMVTMGGFRGGPNAAVLDWVRKHGSPVPDKLWKSPGNKYEPASFVFPSRGDAELFDLESEREPMNDRQN